MHLRRAALALGFVTTAALVLSLAAGATIPVVKIATDPFTTGGLRAGWDIFYWSKALPQPVSF